MYIKLYLTEQEKKQLETMAKQNQMSLSKLCHDRIFPLPVPDVTAHPEAETSMPTDQEEFSEPTFSKANEKSSPTTYGHAVKVYFTESEYASMLSAAKGLPLSRFVRKGFLSRQEPVQILVETEDISLLTMKVSGYIEKLNNLIAALALQQQLYESDYEQLLLDASEMKAALKDAASYAMANRTSIRASGVRMLRKEIRRALKVKNEK